MKLFLLLESLSIFSQSQLICSIYKLINFLSEFTLILKFLDYYILFYYPQPSCETTLLHNYWTFFKKIFFQLKYLFSSSSPKYQILSHQSLYFLLFSNSPFRHYPNGQYPYRNSRAAQLKVTWLRLPLIHPHAPPLHLPLRWGLQNNDVFSLI